MRAKLLCGVAAAAIATAFSGPSLAAPPAPVDWSGWYFGGHIGWGHGNFRATPHGGETADGIATASPSGLVGGIHGGQNWQMNTFVYGWEADVSATGWDAISAFSAEEDRNYIVAVNLLASLRARLGMTLNPETIVYVTGGLAYTQANAIGKSPSSGTITRATHDTFGWVFGLGAEWMQNQNWSWRVEGLWYQFNNTQPLFGFTEDEPGSSRFSDALVVRVGGTYHFSDRRLKRDISFLRRLDNGLRLYRYRYIWSDEYYVGVMAQEVAKSHPDAVVQGSDGYLRVDYRRLGLQFMTLRDWEDRTGIVAMAA